MLDPLDSKNRPYLHALAKKRRRTYISLLIENTTLHAWRLFFWTLFFTGLWMLGLPKFLGTIGQFTSPIIYLIGIIYFTRKDILTFSLPTKEKVDTALEKRSAIARGSITAIDDTLANPKTKQTRDLWNTAQKTILQTFTYLKPPAPRALLSRKDPAAFRYIAILIFLSGALISGNQWHNKITTGMLPIIPSFLKNAGKKADIWITPPDYTQAAQIHLNGMGTHDNTIDIPEGSMLRIRLNTALGNIFQPMLKNAQTTTPLSALGDNLYGLETGIKNAKTLSITQMGLSRIKFKYDYIIDAPPHIQSDIPLSILEEVEIITEEDGAPEPLEETEQPLPYEILDNSQIRIPLLVRDDYSVKELKMKMNIDEMVEHLPLGEPFQETRLVMSGPETEFKMAPIYDLTWHTWAGLPVTFEYVVNDHKDQTATLEKMSFILPERIFEHPMAKSLIAARKTLAWNYDDSFMEISRNLATLLRAPDYFQNNPVIYLAIKTASTRLRHSDNLRQPERIKAAKAVISLLWNAAITVEDGNLSLAMRELRDAQRALENAMRDPNAGEDKIARLMENLREKMNNYFAEMRREMQKRMQDGEEIPQFSADDFSQMISPDTLSKMMEEIESALRNGDEQKAQELMSQLQRMMDMIDPSMTPRLPKDMQVMNDGINELQELIERQELLLEQTNKQADKLRSHNRHQSIKKMPPLDLPSIEKMLKDFGMDSIPPMPKPEAEKKTKRKKTEKPNSTDNPETTALKNKAEQAALRYILGQLMLDAAETLDEIPETMGLSEQEMRGSETALGNNAPSTSIPHQELAIKYLKDAQENLSKQFKQRMQQMVGIGLSGGSPRRDPLGRPYGGKDDPEGQGAGSDVEVPDKNQKKAVDEILRTLRERSGDRSLSDQTREYFRRLLRQY